MHTVLGNSSKDSKRSVGVSWIQFEYLYMYQKATDWEKYNYFFKPQFFDRPKLD